MGRSIFSESLSLGECPSLVIALCGKMGHSVFWEVY